jgi:hypothetical protein
MPCKQIPPTVGYLGTQFFHRRNLRGCGASAEKAFISSEVIWPLKIVAFGIDYFGFLSNLFVDDHC